MTGKWTVPGVPHKGWTCEGISDLGELAAVCQMCEVAEIRYAHQMSHPNYGEVLTVGCICAGFMEQDHERARNRERVFVNELARRRNWLSRKWRLSARGFEFLNTDGFNIVIFHRPGTWASRITLRDGGEFWESKRKYPTSDAAKLGALEGLFWIKKKRGYV